MAISIANLTTELVVSRYLFNSDTPPSDLASEDLIRDDGVLGLPIYVDANEYMTIGGGRFADIARFNFIRNFLAGNDLAAYPNGMGTLPPGEYSTAELLAWYNITQNKLDVQQYYSGVYDADYAQRAYIFGSTAFQINDDAVFHVNADGSRTIENVCVIPVDDNFDYVGGNLAALVTNLLTEDQIDPSGIGRKVPIVFENTMLIPRFNLTDADLPMLEQKNQDAQAAETSVIEMWLNPLYFLGNFELIIGGLVLNDVITYEDFSGKYVVYDGKDPNNSNSNLDAYALRNFTEIVPFNGAVVIAGGGDDTVFGTGFADDLYGGSGNDTLDGREGGDNLYGGIGDDTYIVDDPDDWVVERWQEGTDLVKTGSTHVLEGNVENLELTGTESVNATGNELDNVIKGNSGNNTLDGKAGADEMHGGGGDDIFIVDDEGDSASEEANEGTDLVKSSVSFVLGENIENLDLTGSEDIDGDGNDLKNIIKGNSGSNILFGEGGDDEIYGRGDDDIISGDGGKDQLWGEGGSDVLFGGDQNDELYGGADSDILKGEQGDDYLDGGSGADYLEGGVGKDTYRADNQDTILDEDGLGQVIVDGVGFLKGGTRKASDPENVYQDVNTGTVYQLNGTTLIVNGGLVIEEFLNDDLGIHLETIPDDRPPPEHPDFDEAEHRTSPIVIDLDGDGVETLALSADRFFDHDANGMKESTAWAGADDGFLVRDLNGNGLIDSGRELFGTNTLLQNGQLAANGYQALQDLDSNHDGVLDAADAAFSELRIWRDANSNGRTDAGELMTLTQAGIASFNTQWTNANTVDANGQLHAQVGTAMRTNGTSISTADVWFQVDSSNRINAIPLSENILDVIDLPDAKAFGNLPDLRQAMALDSVLKGLVEAYVAEQDPIQRDAMLEGLIYQWAGVAQINPNSRDPTRVYGHVMDARQLIVLEALVGRGYEGTWCWGERDPNPHGNAAPLLIAEFKEFQAFVRAQLLAQIDSTSYAFIKGGFASGYDSVIVDWQQFQAIATGLEGSGNLEKLTELIGVLRELGRYSADFRVETGQAFAVLLATSPMLSPLFDIASMIGNSGANTLFGNEQDQVIIGNKGNDLLFGAEGNDTYIYSIGDGKDRIYDSAGIDQIVFMGGISTSDITFARDMTSIILKISAGGESGEVRIDNVFDENGNLREGVIETVRLNDGTVWNLQDVLSQIPALITTGDDAIYGTTGDDAIFAQSGNDQLVGLGGNDQLNGESGDDVLLGGNGDDILIGGVGDDVLNGGAGNDTYVFDVGFGHDIIENYDDHADRFDKIEFSAGISATEVTITRVGDDLLLTLAGGDSVRVHRQFEGDGVSDYSINEVRFADGTLWDAEFLKMKTLVSTAGNDQLFGFSTDDAIDGLAGNDTIEGRAGQDHLSGGDGDDTIDGGDGNDTLLDGTGSDVLRGGNGDDVIYLSADRLTGGTDVATGGDGDDVYYISRNSGVDRITGLGSVYSGTDRVVLSDITSAMIRDYQISGSDLYLFIGEAGSGVIENTIILEGFLRGDAPSHVLEFAGGVTMTRTTFATAYWSGTSGADVYSGSFAPDQINGGAGDDMLSGGLGPDRIYGGDGNDILHGNQGNDILESGTGADILYGDEGDDLLVNSAGWATQMFGGVGNDTYQFFLYQTGASDYYTSAGVTELEGEGNDTVITNYYHFSLNNTSIENLIVKNCGYQWTTWNGKPIDRKIFGNELDNTIQVTGNSFIYGSRIVIDGGLGNDTMIGGEGDETFVVDSIGDIVIEQGTSSKSDTVRASISYSIEDSPNIENIELTANDTTATGNSGNNVLDGSMAAGANTLIGGAGDDTYIIDSNDIVIEQADGGTDTIVIKKFAPGTTSFDVSTSANNVEIYQLHKDAGTGVGIIGSEGNDILIGNDKANSLNGGAGDDELRSGGSEYQRSDSLYGGEGNDLLISDNGYYAYLNGGLGNDELRIGAGTTSESIRYDRGDGSDVIVSLSGSNYGTCSFTFGPSINPDNAIWSRDDNDLLITFSDSVGDQVRVKDYWAQENGVDVLTSIVDTFGFWNEPFHRSGLTLEALRNKPPVRNYSTLDASVPTGQTFTYTLPVDAFSDENAESLVYSVDDLPDWLSFDPLTRTIQGTPPSGQVDQYYQVTATDIYEATAYLTLHVSFVNVIQGTSGNDSLMGTSGVDILIGGAGNDTLNGGASGDQLIGGTGNDIYTVDNANDQVVEELDEGDDLVNASVSYALSDNVERLTLTGSATEGAGNDLDNVITGNSSVNYLYGNEGNDTLKGNNGNDELYGGSGNDTLDGGSGSDYMAGEDGDDIYIVDNVGDVVDESKGSGEPSLAARESEDSSGNGGIDTVKSSLTWTLGENIENLILTGTSAINGFGNELDNVIVGNSGANTLRGYEGNDMLDGGSGNDTMFGGIGDDTYVVNATGDVVTELANEGIDTVRSQVTLTLGNNVENLILTGTSAINGTGNALDNILTGNSGKNSLSGGAGNDTLDGAAGIDTLTGGTGADTYLHGRGYGVDTVVENDATTGTMDVAKFLAGVAYDQLWFARPSGTSNLEITIIGTSDKLTIKDWYKGSQYQVEEIRTTDGNYLLTAAKVQALVTKMATITKPSTLTLTASQRSQLDSVFAATWVQQAPVAGLMSAGNEIGSQGMRLSAALQFESSLPQIMPSERIERSDGAIYHISVPRIENPVEANEYATLNGLLDVGLLMRAPLGDWMEELRDPQYAVGGVNPLNVLDRHAQASLDTLYGSLSDTMWTERSDFADTDGIAPGLRADVAVECQRLIGAMSLADANDASLIANCEVWRNRLGVEATMF